MAEEIDIYPEGAQWAALPSLERSGEAWGTSFEFAEPVPDLVVPVKLVLQQRQWNDPDAAPDWPEVTVMGTEAHAITLGNEAVNIEGEGGDAVRSASHTQSRWRLAWQVPEAAPSQWQFVHLRFDVRDTRFTVGEESPVVTNDAREIWWKGDVPGGYDADNPATWPGMVLEDTTGLTAPDAGMGGSVTRQIVFNWPLANGPRSGTGVLYDAPGQIPGRYSYLGQYHARRLGSGWRQYHH